MTPSAFGSAPPAGPLDAPDAACLIVNHADRADLQAWLRARGLDDAPLVLVQPGNKRTLKRRRAEQRGDDKHWPVANWTELVRAVSIRQPDAGVILCGAPPEAEMLRRIAAAAGSGRVVAAGNELPLRRLLALCEHAAAMVSVDTGPAQAAAALGCPLIVMYGAQPPSLWLPRSPTGSPVIALGGLPGRSRVDQISIEEVVTAWERLPLRRCCSRSSRIAATTKRNGI